MVKINVFCVLIIAMLPTAALAVPVGPAPAPLIGAGLPVVLAVGGVLLGRRVVKRLRRHAGD